MKYPAMWFLTAAAVAAVLAAAVSCGDVTLSDDDDDDSAAPADDDAADDDDGAPDDDDATTDDDVDTSVPIPDGEITWDNYVYDFISAYCLRCHGEQPTEDAEIRLNTYERVKNNAEEIYEKTVEKEKMPEGAPYPTRDERDALGEWILNGMPEN
ncbi:MAG: hypothetical protein M5R36_12360 [Deltaproteobacteria bacterium]|nr:hypothetical protein [Deltaproteobacteria bacterium]